MKEIVAHAYNTVPGYQKLYKDVNISPDDIQQLSDIRHFPFVTKELLRDNIKDFTSRAIPQWKRLYRTTGGSTGIPFGYFLMQEDIEREMAFLHSASNKDELKNILNSDSRFFAFAPHPGWVGHIEAGKIGE